MVRAHFMDAHVRKKAPPAPKYYLHRQEQLLSQLGDAKLRLEAERERRLQAQERDALLLDLLLHQELLLQLLRADFASCSGEGGEDDGATACSVPGPGVSGRAASPSTLPPCVALEEEEAQRQSQEQQQVEQQQVLQQQVEQQQVKQQQDLQQQVQTLPPPPLPDSYAAFLLLSASAADVESVRRMTAHDWCEFFRQTFFELLLLLELIDRCPDATDAADADAADVTSPCAATDSAGARSGRGGPTHALQRLQQVMDTLVRRVLLGFLYSHMPMLQACTVDYTSGCTSRPSAAHWRRVVARLRLSQSQARLWAAAHREHARLAWLAAASGGAAAANVAFPGPLAAAAVASATPAATAWTGSGSGSSSGKTGTCIGSRSGGCGRASSFGSGGGGDELAAPAALSGGPPSVGPGGDERGPDTAAAQLQSHVVLLHLQLRMFAMFYINSLSHVQLAQMVVASYPFIPMFASVAAIVAAQHEAGVADAAAAAAARAVHAAAEASGVSGAARAKLRPAPAPPPPFDADGAVADADADGHGAALQAALRHDHVAARSAVMLRQLRWWQETQAAESVEGR